MTERNEKLQAQKKKQQNQKADKSQLVIEYRAIAKSPALEDILNKCQGFADYHQKLAKDAVGYEQENTAGTLTQRTVRFTPEQRVSELDKAAGIEEIIDYIKRMLDAGIPKPDEA